MNIYSIFWTSEVSKLSKLVIDSIELQLLNIYAILFTLLVLNLFKSIDFKLLHSLNMYSIFVTEEVSKLFKLLIDTIELQLLNIFPIFSTRFVLNAAKSKDCKFLQLLNMYSILVTADVSKLPKLAIDSIELQSLNI